ncbi:MBL fold metallo-hydrolase [Brevibacterium sp. 91QC2O2]|uniref:MBL fold metallo-hydrolase n=1 Tax=Brevibacterium sp. 91QC2O2 TaxID=2968458 RepID=UPI00211CA527|nr:MBL fold metallo-hydrolase [Brevibacterium sp. 91QC2O2]
MAEIYSFTSDPVALNSYLVVGEERALVIDTGSGPAQATGILRAFRTVTGLPLCVVNTHDHWDHFFGNATCAARGIDTFYGAAGFLRDSQASAWVQFENVPLSAEPDLPSDPGDLIVPATELAAQDSIDLGGGTVVETLELAGHTESDLVLRVDDVAFTGDLVEEGQPPQFGDDATPARWAQALRRILLFEGVTAYLPGHGNPVDRRFVQAQAADVAGLAADHTAVVPARNSAGLSATGQSAAPVGLVRIR